MGGRCPALILAPFDPKSTPYHNPYHLLYRPTSLAGRAVAAAIDKSESGKLFRE